MHRAVASSEAAAAKNFREVADTLRAEKSALEVRLLT